MHLVQAEYHSLLRRIRSVTTGGKGHNCPGAKSLWGRRMIVAGAEKP